MCASDPDSLKAEARDREFKASWNCSMLFQTKTKLDHLPSIVTHCCNPSTWEAEAGGQTGQFRPHLTNENSKEGYQIRLGVEILDWVLRNNRNWRLGE